MYPAGDRIAQKSHDQRALNFLHDRTGYSVPRAIRQNNESGGLKSRRYWTTCLMSDFGTSMLRRTIEKKHKQEQCHEERMKPREKNTSMGDITMCIGRQKDPM